METNDWEWTNWKARFKIPETLSDRDKFIISDLLEQFSCESDQPVFCGEEFLASEEADNALEIAPGIDLLWCLGEFDFEFSEVAARLSFGNLHFLTLCQLSKIEAKSELDTWSFWFHIKRSHEQKFKEQIIQAVEKSRVRWKQSLQ